MGAGFDVAKQGAKKLATRNLRGPCRVWLAEKAGGKLKRTQLVLPNVVISESGK